MKFVQDDPKLLGHREKSHQNVKIPVSFGLVYWANRTSRWGGLRDPGLD